MSVASPSVEFTQLVDRLVSGKYLRTARGTFPVQETPTLANLFRRTLNVQGTWSLPMSTATRTYLALDNVSTTTGQRLARLLTSRPPPVSIVVQGCTWSQLGWGRSRRLEGLDASGWLVPF